MKPLFSIALISLFIVACSGEEPPVNAPAAPDYSSEIISTAPVVPNAHFIADKLELPEFDAPETTIKDLYGILDKKGESFTIRGDRDTTVACKEGTELVIKANSFADARTGKPIKGSVKVTVKEYYGLDDIMSSGLHTMSSTGILETGGMLRIDARANGRSAALAKGKNMDISMPFGTKKEGMRLFNGRTKSNGELEWIPAEPPVPQPVDGSSIFDAIDEKPDDLIVVDEPDFESVGVGNGSSNEPDDQTFMIVEKMPEFPGGESAMYSYLNSTIQYPRVAMETGVQGVVYVNFIIEKDGKISETKILRGIHPACDKEAMRVIKNMPAWKPGTQRGKAVKVSFNIPIRFTISGRGLNYNTNDLAAAEAFEATTTDATIQTKTVEEIQRYVFSTSQLGWINCDRWSRYEGQKVTLLASIEASIYTDAKLIFKNERVIMPGRISKDDGWLFSQVPVGEAVTLIVFKYDEGKTFMSIKEFTIDASGKAPQMSFKEVTMAELKSAVNTLKNKSVPI